MMLLLYVSTVLSLVLVFIKRFHFSKGMYPFVFGILLGQLYFLRREFLKKNAETFQEEPLALHTLDTQNLKVAYQTPLKMKQEIEPSLNAFVKSTKANDDTVFLNPQKKKYTNSDLRRTWREIDYLLEKIKVFSPRIYGAIVPKLSKEQIEADKEREEKEEFADGGKENEGGGNVEEMRKERERKDTENRLKKEIVEEQRL